MNRTFFVLKQYYQLAKPGIIYGNLMMTLSGYLLASRWRVNPIVLVSLLAGTGLVIACGCVLNNCFDRKIDGLMRRTKKRALPAGEIKNMSAVVYAGILGVAGFAVLSLAGWTIVWLGATALVGYALIYTYLKRVSIWGTLVGTLPGAAPLVAGYAAGSGRLDTGAWLLVAMLAAWQLAHFYSIAIRRLDDYTAANLPVWPVKRGTLSTKRQILLSIVLFGAANLYLSLTGYTGIVYLICSLSLSGWWLLRAIDGFGTDDHAAWAGRMFGSSLVVLIGLSASMALSPLVF